MCRDKDKVRAQVLTVHETDATGIFCRSIGVPSRRGQGLRLRRRAGALRTPRQDTSGHARDLRAGHGRAARRWQGDQTAIAVETLQGHRHGGEVVIKDMKEFQKADPRRSARRGDEHVQRDRRLRGVYPEHKYRIVELRIQGAEERWA